MPTHLGIEKAVRLLRLAGCIAVGFGTTGCFLVTNLDRFHQNGDDGGGAASAKDDPTEPSALKLTLKGMGVHLNQTIEFRVVDSNNFVQSRGVVEPLDAPATESVTFTLPKGIPSENGPYRLDFYADVNGSRSFDGLETGLTHDHAWRIEPLADSPAGKFPHAANVVEVIFNHNKLFTDINEWPKGTVASPQGTGVDVVVHFSAAKMSEFVGKLCQVRVLEARTGHTVGLYRIPEVPSSDFAARIAGVVEAGEAYNVDVYLDSNGNAAYDDPASTGASVDLGWRFPMNARPLGGASDGGIADAGAAARTSFIGIDFDFDPSASPGVIDLGVP